MNIRRNLLLLFLYMAAASSLPSLYDDWDSQDLNSDSITSDGLGLSDIGLSDPQDSTNLYTIDEYPSISGDIALADPGFDGATTTTFQALTEDGLSGSNTGFDDGKFELAKDDICQDGYWNRCCNSGLCFWGMFIWIRLN